MFFIVLFYPNFFLCFFLDLILQVAFFLNVVFQITLFLLLVVGFAVERGIGLLDVRRIFAWLNVHSSERFLFF